MLVTIGAPTVGFGFRAYTCSHTDSLPETSYGAARSSGARVGLA